MARWYVTHNTSGILEYEVEADTEEEALAANIPEEYAHEWSVTTYHCNSEVELLEE